MALINNRGRSSGRKWAQVEVIAVRQEKLVGHVERLAFSLMCNDPAKTAWDVDVVLSIDEARSLVERLGRILDAIDAKRAALAGGVR